MTPNTDAVAARLGELCERLRRTCCVQIDPERQAIRSLNPDGPEAATAIEALLAERAAANARVKEAEGVIAKASAWFTSAIGTTADGGCDWLNEGGWDELPEVADSAAQWLAHREGRSDG